MDPAQRKMMAIMMPAIFGFSMLHFASGLALYWGTGNVINLAIQLGVNQSSIGKEMHEIAARTRRQKNRRQPQDHPGQAVTSSPRNKSPVQVQLERGFYRR